jgi:hypothetical protein
LALVCFCVACLFAALGDLSPMIFAFRLMVCSPAACELLRREHDPTSWRKALQTSRGISRSLFQPSIIS